MSWRRGNDDAEMDAVKEKETWAHFHHNLNVQALHDGHKFEYTPSLVCF